MHRMCPTAGKQFPYRQSLQMAIRLDNKTGEEMSRGFSPPSGGVRLSPLGTSATIWPIVPAPGDGWYECGAVGGMRIGRGNRNTRRKPTPVPLCPPQIPHDLTCTRTRAAAVRSLRLTAWAMAPPLRKWVTRTGINVARKASNFS
jgi:hypothetical protein